MPAQGASKDASEVGESGETNGVSWPATTDVFFHSPGSTDPSKRPHVVLRFYRLPPAAAR